MVEMETQHIQAVFEVGKLLPLQPLNLDEHERVEVTIVRSGSAASGSDESEVLFSSLLNAADDTITLEQVQRALAKINGSLVDDFARERDERQHRHDREHRLHRGRGDRRRLEAS